MASHTIVKILPRIGFKRANLSHTSFKRLQNSFVLSFERSDLPWTLPVVATEKPEKKAVEIKRELVPVLHYEPPKQRKLPKTRKNSFEHRLELLQKQLKCNREEVLEIYNKAPRLCDIRLFDEVIRNVEILLHIYDSTEVISLVANRVTVLTQVDNRTLLDLVRRLSKHQGIKVLAQSIDLLVKEEDVKSNPEPVSSLVVPSKQEPMLLTGGMSYSIMKEKINYLISEGFSMDFLREYNHILMFSMKRIRKEIQYMKNEFGEVDHRLFTSRFGSLKKAKKYRRSLNTAAELLDCSKADFTRLQMDHLLRLLPGDVEGSIKYLLQLGFSKNDIKSCVYIIGHPREQIDKAKHEVLKNCDIDINNKKVYINAIQYRIKQWEGFGVS